MSRRSKMLISLAILVLCCVFGAELAQAASSYDNESVISGGVGLSSVDDTIRQLARGIVRVVRPIVIIMTALAGVIVTLNLGEAKRPIWNAILGMGLALNFGSVLWEMWGSYANHQAIIESVGAAIDYSIKIKDESNADGSGVDILSQFMKQYLLIIVTGAARIKPIAIKLLLMCSLISMSIELALDLTEKDKITWLTRNLLKIGFYIFLIQNWLGFEGLNLMDTLSKGFQQIGFLAGGASDAVPTSIGDIGSIDAKNALSPDSIINNAFKMFNTMFSAAMPQPAPAPTPTPPADTGVLDKIGETIGGIFDAGKQVATNMYNSVVHPIDTLVSNLTFTVSLLVGLFCIFWTAVEMFMARIEFYTLALLGMPLLAFGTIKHFEYLAQQTIRAVFNCGVKVCVISFLQAILCKMYSKYINDIISIKMGNVSDWSQVLIMGLQILLVNLILLLIVLKIPKIIQGLLSGNPSMGGSDMMGTATAMAGAATSTAGKVATGVGLLAGASAAAGMAKAAAAGGKEVAPWKMSEMKQFGAALLRRAPITGQLFDAYQETAKYGDNRDNEKSTHHNDPLNNNPPGGGGGDGGAGLYPAAGTDAENPLSADFSNPSPPAAPAQAPVQPADAGNKQGKDSDQEFDTDDVTEDYESAYGNPVSLMPYASFLSRPSHPLKRHASLRKLPAGLQGGIFGAAAQGFDTDDVTESYDSAYKHSAPAVAQTVLPMADVSFESGRNEKHNIVSDARSAPGSTPALKSPRVPHDKIETPPEESPKQTDIADRKDPK